MPAARASSARRVVRAAGGLVWRERGKGQLQVLLVTRSAGGGWGWPKGKRAGDEDDVDTALREVEEETGLRCDPGPELAPTAYLDRAGRPKSVRYWAMQLPAGRKVTAQNEIKAVRWSAADKADRLLEDEHDRVVLAHLVELHAHGRLGLPARDDRETALPDPSPGCRQLRRARSTGAVIGVYDRRSFAVDHDSRWQVVCHNHDAARSFGTLAEARREAAAPEAWCRGCRAVLRPRRLFHRGRTR